MISNAALKGRSSTVLSSTVLSSAFVSSVLLSLSVLSSAFLFSVSGFLGGFGFVRHLFYAHFGYAVAF